MYINYIYTYKHIYTYITEGTFENICMYNVGARVGIEITELHPKP
jgi:hypothetical protein